MFETQRLILRNFKEEDLKDFYELTSNKKIGSMSGLIYLTDINSAKVLLKDFTNKQHLFAIVLKNINKVVGLIELMDYDEKSYKGIDIVEGTKEIAFLLNESYWGKGIMQEAMKVVLQWAFQELEITKILSGNYEENIQSAKFQEKIGFKKIGEIDCLRVVENKKTKFIQREINKEEYLKLL